MKFLTFFPQTKQIERVRGKKKIYIDILNVLPFLQTLRNFKNFKNKN